MSRTTHKKSTKNINDFNYNEIHNGEKLLSYLSISPTIDTYKFTSLIMELNPSREITDNEILKYKPLVKIIATKFKNSGEQLDD